MPCSFPLLSLFSTPGLYLTSTLFLPSLLPSFLPSFLSFFLPFFLSIYPSFFLSFFLCFYRSFSPSIYPRIPSPSHPPPSQAAAGSFHTAFVTLGGALLTCGRGNAGLLGHGSRRFGEGGKEGKARLTVAPAERVDDLYRRGIRVARASCGYAFTAALRWNSHHQTHPQDSKCLEELKKLRQTLGLQQLIMLMKLLGMAVSTFS